MASGSSCSPAEYHMRYSLADSSQFTCGHITAVFSQGLSGERTGRGLLRSQRLPSRLLAYPIQECPFACPVYHMEYPSDRLTTICRFTSSSHCAPGLGARQMTDRKSVV